MDREVMTYDVVIIGAGPAGLAAAIRLKQLSQAQSQEVRVCVLEKGSEVGAHILSGAVIDPIALNELLPQWPSLNAPVTVRALQDEFLFLTPHKAYRLPTPGPLQNPGNYIVSLGKLCKFLASQAEALGVEIYPGFPAVDVISHDGAILGVITGDRGVNKAGIQTPQFQAGIEIRAKQILVAEGCRGSLTKKLFDQFNLRAHCDPQTYGLGVKELWEVDSPFHQPGKVMHSIGWPLENEIYGGSFLYHLDQNQIAIGFAVGLDYQNPYLNPFQILQQFKTHPRIAPLLKNGKRLCYGAKAISEGGWQAIPQLSFKGGLLIGDCAGFLNTPRIKGTHTAMKSGMVAAEVVFAALQEGLTEGQELKEFKSHLEASWLWRELFRARNIRPAFRFGLWGGLLYSAVDHYIFRGSAPWTLRYHHGDHQTLIPAADAIPPHYPPADDKLTFDKLSSVYISNTMHAEDQPCHLQLQQPERAVAVNLKVYGGPEQYYCPAQVYEYLDSGSGPYLQINATNCLHCKTCDIKDPTQNINWVPPEGGGGPNYVDM